MRAGQLRTRVVIEESSLSYNALNEATAGWSTQIARWARVVSDGGREFVAAKQVVAELTDVVEIRYTPGVLPQNRVRIGARLLDIRAVVDVDEKHEMHRLYCVERASVAAVVSVPVVPPGPVLTTLTFDVSPVTITGAAGTTATLTVTARDELGVVMAGVVVGLVSNNTGVVTVSPASAATNGSGVATFTLTSVANGTTTITASSGAVTTDDTVTCTTGPTVYFLHTFSGGANPSSVGTADTGQTPIVLGSATWGVDSSGRAYVSATGPDGAVVFDMGHADGTLSALAAVMDPASAIWRLCARATNKDNLIELIALDANTYSLYKLVAGAATQIGTWTTVHPATGQTPTLVMLDDQITVKIGATTLGTVTEAFNKTATKHGFVSDSTSTNRFDNLTLTA